MKICVIIPVYNESKAIGPLVVSLKRKNLSVVVVDDGSMDGAGEIAKEKGATVIRHETKHGKGFALQTGFQFALSNHFDGVITLDGDGQHDIDDIDPFLEYARKKEADLIIGNRMGNPKDMPLLRYLTNCFMSFLISLSCGRGIPDTQCGYRYISDEVLKSISFHSRDYEIESEILMKACKKNFRVMSIPIHSIYRNEESHIHPFKDTVRFFSYYFRELFSSKN